MSGNVAAAARTTLETGSSRIRQQRFVDPPGQVTADLPVDEGVTNFAAVRTRVEHQWQGTPRWAESLLERYPWLTTGDKDDEENVPAGLTVHAGTATYFWHGDRWTVISPRDAQAVRRGHADPAWIIEALHHVAESAVDERPPELIDGAPCSRWRFLLDPNIAGGALGLPPHSGSRAPRIAGEVWIDADDRIRRVQWTQLRRQRPRSPWKAEPEQTLWHIVELWDFGVIAEIDVPDVEPDGTPWPLALAQLGWELRRRKRAYERRGS